MSTRRATVPAEAEAWRRRCVPVCSSDRRKRTSTRPLYQGGLVALRDLREGKKILESLGGRQQAAHGEVAPVVPVRMRLQVEVGKAEPT
jgi:hypothetical protein